MTPDYIIEGKSTIRFFNCDNLLFMKDISDKYYDLAIVDPPYGNNLSGGRSSKNGWNNKINWDKCNKEWNLNPPKQEYFVMLQRISKNQIICGGNYFANLLPNSEGWIVWDKGQREFSLADGEMIWTSFDKAMRIYTLSRSVANQEDKIHATQKPIQLYRWLLQKYAKPGQKIFYSHGGSFSHAIACDMEGFDLDICEIDKEYFDAGVNRFKTYKSQLKMF